MRSLMNFFILFLLVYQLTGCAEDDVVVKTLGEINGEKIMDLVNSDVAPAQCYIWKPDLKKYFSFEVEGQFLNVTSMNTENYSLMFDLNNLAYFQVESNYLEVYLNE